MSDNQVNQGGAREKPGQRAVGELADLARFRREHPLRCQVVDDIPWEYLSTGQGAETLLFLHGLAGSADIWWQLIEAFAGGYRCLAVTCPAVDTLERMSAGLLAILEAGGVSQANIVGTSMGGYVAQYLVARHPGRVRRAVFANTFVDPQRLPRYLQLAGGLLPVVPEWLALAILRLDARLSLYPASGRSDLLLAYLLKEYRIGMSKSLLMTRYRCVSQPFRPANRLDGIPCLILEANNDPVIDLRSRALLRAAYPGAQVVTLPGCGHFGYLSHPGLYGQALANFLYYTP